MKYIVILVLLAVRTVCIAVDAKSYGAKGDGIQDDSPYLNNAIAKAVFLGEDLFIPAGTYKCDMFSPGFDSKILVMDQSGIKKTRIYGEAGTKITTSQPLGCLLTIYYATENMVIENIFFENTHAITLSQTNAIGLGGIGENLMTNFIIRNCTFEGFSTAISAQGIHGLTIQNNIFQSSKGHDNAQDNSQPAVYIWLADNENGQCYDVNILNNTASGFTGTDITQTYTKRPMDGFVYGKAYGIKIQGNVTRNFSEEHIALQPLSTNPDAKDSVLISGNKLYEAIPLGSMKDGAPLTSNYGIRIDCNNVTISNNDFYDYTIGVLIWPFQYPTLKQHDYTVSGNRFYSPHTSMYYMSEAIKVQADSRSPAFNITIIGNTISIDNIQMKENKSIISVYDCVQVTIKNNTLKTRHIDLNGFLLSGIFTFRCEPLITEGNIVSIKIR